MAAIPNTMNVNAECIIRLVSGLFSYSFEQGGVFAFDSSDVLGLAFLSIATADLLVGSHMSLYFASSLMVKKRADSDSLHFVFFAKIAPWVGNNELFYLVVQASRKISAEGCCGRAVAERTSTAKGTRLMSRYSLANRLNAVFYFVRHTEVRGHYGGVGYAVVVG